MTVLTRSAVALAAIRAISKSVINHASDEIKEGVRVPLEQSVFSEGVDVDRSVRNELNCLLGFDPLNCSDVDLNKLPLWMPLKEEWRLAQWVVSPEQLTNKNTYVRGMIFQDARTETVRGTNINIDDSVVEVCVVLTFNTCTSLPFEWCGRLIDPRYDMDTIQSLRGQAYKMAIERAVLKHAPTYASECGGACEFLPVDDLALNITVNQDQAPFFGFAKVRFSVKFSTHRLECAC